MIGKHNNIWTHDVAFKKVFMYVPESLWSATKVNKERVLFLNWLPQSKTSRSVLFLILKRVLIVCPIMKIIFIGVSCFSRLCLLLLRRVKNLHMGLSLLDLLMSYVSFMHLSSQNFKETRLKNYNTFCFNVFTITFQIFPS